MVKFCLFMRLGPLQQKSSFTHLTLLPQTPNVLHLFSFQCSMAMTVFFWEYRAARKGRASFIYASGSWLVEQTPIDSHTQENITSTNWTG